MTQSQYAVLPLTFLLAASLQAQPIQIQLELLNQIGTDTSRKGDLISGRVLTPANLQGDIIEGKITESKSGAKLGGQSAFSFAFDTLRHAGGAPIPISTQFKSVANSKGKANVDEEGRIVKRATGNVAKAAGGTGVGALIGGIAGGGKGAAIGAAVGAGASILLIQIAADGPNIRFSPGSRFIIEASARDGSSLGALTPAAPTQNPSAKSSSPATSSWTSTPAVAQPQSTPPQPEMTTLKSTFIPGEKTIFYDDFTDMTADDAPPHFKVRGSAPQLKTDGHVRQLTVTANGTITPNLTSLPKNFTYEADMKVDAPRRAIASLIFSSKNKDQLHVVSYFDPKQMDIVASLRAPFQELGRKRIPADRNDVLKFALWIQNGRMRVFINGEKHLDFNQVDLPPIDRIDFTHSLYAGDAIGYRTVRFAESTPDFSQVITSSGRFVTHGILFDTDSDRIKAESAPVIQSIAKGLETNPALKLKIEGHTDSLGDPAHNMDLSRRRAEAVKTILVSQFNVDAARLTTAGLGATKPIDSNDTPQGRSQNRRVEFVKQ
jgi:OOP family OmpA-OmpF porin